MPKRAAPRPPSPSKSASETRRIMAKLATQHPNADTELHYSNPYELLVATILSAQCTDERVNQVTPPLFKKYPDPRALARATTAELEPQIQSTGFFRSKSRSLLGMATDVVERYGGKVPGTMDDLVQLPGVGRKTANVVLGHALGVPGLPVDRHVLRVSNRIGIAEGDDPVVVEQQLCAAMPRERWTRTSDTLILHGRRICRPKPLCDECAVRDDCDSFRLVIARARDGKPLRKPKSNQRAAVVSGAKSPAAAAKPVRRGAKPASSARKAPVPAKVVKAATVAAKAAKAVAKRAGTVAAPAANKQARGPKSVRTTRR